MQPSELSRGWGAQGLVEEEELRQAVRSLSHEKAPFLYFSIQASLGVVNCSGRGAHLVLLPEGKTLTENRGDGTFLIYICDGSNWVA